MEEENKDAASSIFETVSQLLSENSETLEAVSNNTESKQSSTPAPAEWSLGRAPVRTVENDPNFKLIPEEDTTSLIDTRNNPENIQSAVSMLLGAPEFKDFIGQYALSNDIAKNIKTIQQAISQQKNFEETPERIGEVDGKYFTGGEAYFLQELLNKVQDTEGQGDFNGSEDANTFFDQLRSDINTEVLQKIEKKENIESKRTFVGQAAEQGALNDMLTDPDHGMEQIEALNKAAKLLSEREGDVIEDATKEEIYEELKRILDTPEYKQAQIEEIGYDPEIGHPDREIQDYLKAKKEWSAKTYSERDEKPTVPENYEERLNRPKIEYNSLIKQGATHENALSTIYSQLNQQQVPFLVNEPIPVPNKDSLFYKEQTTIEPTSTKDLSQEITPQEQPVSTKDLSREIIPQQQTIFETTSELPTSDMFAQAEESKDETSAEILANTEKTNTTLEGLTQVLGMLMQTLGTQMQQPPPAPVSVPAPQASSSQPGMSDAMLASGSGMISTIRGKFIYSV
jgi:hypothetical protein